MLIVGLGVTIYRATKKEFLRDNRKGLTEVDKVQVCIKCGNRVPNDAIFCPYCKSEIS